MFFKFEENMKNLEQYIVKHKLPLLHKQLHNIIATTQPTTQNNLKQL